MLRISIGLLVVLLLIDISAGAQQAAKPFPQHVRYYKGTIKPNHISQARLDGLPLDFYKDHRNNHKYLMAWAQDKNCKSIDPSSATDGDMDIAYSLLLAAKQWGSNGTINYLKEAQNMIAAIMKYEINPKTYSIILSDAVEYDSKDYFDTRTSEFMPDHFKAFEKASKDERWKKVVDYNYRLFKYMEDNYS